MKLAVPGLEYLTSVQCDVHGAVRVYSVYSGVYSCTVTLDPVNERLNAGKYTGYEMQSNSFI